MGESEMTFIQTGKYILVRCEIGKPDCWNGAENGHLVIGLNKQDCMDKLKSQGWRIGSYDACPNCVKKMKEEECQL